MERERERKDVVLTMVLIVKSGVDNGLDRERVDVVDDDRARTRTQTNNRNGHGNPPKQQSNIVLGVVVERGPAIATIMATIDVPANNMTSSMSDASDNK